MGLVLLGMTFNLGEELCHPILIVLRTKAVFAENSYLLQDYRHKLLFQN